MMQWYFYCLIWFVACSPRKPTAEKKIPTNTPTVEQHSAHQLAKLQKKYPSWLSIGEGNLIGDFCSPVGAIGFLRNYQVSCPPSKKGKARTKNCSGPVTCEIIGVGPERRVQWNMSLDNYEKHTCLPCQ